MFAWTTGPAFDGPSIYIYGFSKSITDPPECDSLRMKQKYFYFINAFNDRPVIKPLNKTHIIFNGISLSSNQSTWFWILDIGYIAFIAFNSKLENHFEFVSIFISFHLYLFFFFFMIWEILLDRTTKRPIRCHRLII